ncbi:MAG TPA: hypothetical protein VHB27_12240 [Rhodopila sp.]|uniref:hypothetical protein n=1 Tax=Rhodopila sp. TaxID=2480087 RepID=UPI002CAF7416|nr:hypothetical protein [Rhodopila sp.]HVY15989.1 hypothetical protein [Rhodopila sp.]
MNRWSGLAAMCILALAGPVGVTPVQARPPQRAKPTPLSATDETQRREAIQRLNASNPVMVGMKQEWKGDSAEGAVRLDRLYRDRGLECHLLVESVRSGEHGRWRVTHPVWCRGADGDWRLHS